MNDYKKIYYNDSYSPDTRIINEFIRSKKC